MIRLTFGGEGLCGFDPVPFSDSYVKLQLPPPGADYGPPFETKQIKATRPKQQWFRQRTYTVKTWDPENRLLGIEFLTHGQGLAGPWAASASRGDRVQMIGPGGAYMPSPDAVWHLLAGDDAAIPAISVTLSRLAEGSTARVFLEVEDESEVRPLDSPADIELTWLFRRGRPHSEAGLIFEAIRGLEFPPGFPGAFIHGEAGMVRAVRKHLILERGIPREMLSATGYWKYSRTEEGWREEKPEWKRQVELDLV